SRGVEVYRAPERLAQRRAEELALVRDPVGVLGAVIAPHLEGPPVPAIRLEVQEHAHLDAVLEPVELERRVGIIAWVAANRDARRAHEADAVGFDVEVRGVEGDAAGPEGHPGLGQPDAVAVAALLFQEQAAAEQHAQRGRRDHAPGWRARVSNCCRLTARRGKADGFDMYVRGHESLLRSAA